MLYEDEFNRAAVKIIGANRIKHGLPPIPDPIRGDLSIVESLQELLMTVYNLLERPAENHCLTQVAEPARHVRNLIKPHLPLLNENINPSK